MEAVHIVKSIRIATGKPGTPEQKLEAIRALLAQVKVAEPPKAKSSRKRKETDEDRMSRGGYDRKE